MAEEKKKTSRREFLKKSGYVTGGVVGGGLLGGLLGSEFWSGEQQTSVAPATQQHDHALQYFTNMNEFNILAQATERIYPEDENGPGAIGLGVPYYIDHQLAGKWGMNAKMYMQGPFHEGEPEQGYQTPLKRHEIFDLGIEALENYSQSNFNDGFRSLEGEQQDEVLIAFENNEVDLPGTSSSHFFELLRETTIEGVYADPLYGGNRNMEGWRMKEYPGVQMTYAQEVETEEFLEIEPSSLHNTHHTR